jgi:putative pyruvate formate lyase activating enzyme
MLRISEEFSDIYIPDFKYSDSNLAQNFSGCPDYPKVSLQALDVMIKQKGFLDIYPGDDNTAQKGVLVRHLILPGHIENSINAMTMLFIEFGSSLPVSLMSQFYPVRRVKNKSISRTLLVDEFCRVYDHCVDLGFENIFFQYPVDGSDTKNCPSPFLPDFTLSSPFHQQELKCSGQISCTKPIAFV